MTTFTIPDTSATPGIPSQGSDVFVPGYLGLVTGDVPPILEVELTFAASQNIPAYTLVGFDGGGDLVPAVSGTTQAIGITITAAVTPGSGNKKSFPIYRQGCFNPNKLNWPVSYDTAAKKQAAFQDAPTPTSIIVRAPKTATE